MLALISLTLIILFVGAAFSIDIAYMHTTRAELRTACDAAARAASEAQRRLQDDNAAVVAAIDIAARNQVAGQPLLLDPPDVVLGTHTQLPGGRFAFVPGGTPANSFRVNARRTTDSASGPVPLFFGPLFGRTHFQPAQTATASRLDRDIALVLDVSGSMASEGRFDALQHALAVFLAQLQELPQEEFVSLTVYNQEARRLVAITSDLESIAQAFDGESPDGMTAIGLGLDAGLDSLLSDPYQRSSAFKEVIVMTDGNHNTDINPLTLIPRARSNNITINTITFSLGANQSLMADLAFEGKGIHLHASSDQQLVEAFREIALQLPVMLIE